MYTALISGSVSQLRSVSSVEAIISEGFCTHVGEFPSDRPRISQTMRATHCENFLNGLCNSCYYSRDEYELRFKHELCYVYYL